jgi:D-glucosaminate-6-phosphate ammonia-lyase
MHIYEQLGVRRVINAYEHLTRLGGSIMDPEVLAAMTEASQWYIDLDQLQERVGQRIAARIGVEAAYVTGGAAAGLLISAAACIAGTDPARITRLPDTRGMRNEIVVERSHRNRYDHALRQVGATFVEYGYARGTEPWELEAAITPQTAAVAYCVTNATPWSLPLPTVATIAHRHGLPVIVDAAAELPPAENLRRFVDEGGDLVVFSGGKGLRGPQPSGLILGRRDLIVACAANASPRHTIGRPMKIGKEEMVGLLVAVERYLQEPPEVRQGRWEEYVQTAVDMLRELPGLTPERIFPMPTGKLIPRALVRVAADCPLTANDIMAALAAGDPAIEVRPDPVGFIIDAQVLQPGDIEVICQRIHAIVCPKNVMGGIATRPTRED